MLEVIRNPEWKSAAVKLVALQLLLSILMFFFMNNQVGRINQTIVDQNAALIGHVLMKNPQLERELVPYITQGAPRTAVDEGNRILAQYGYQQGMSIEDQPPLSGLALPMKTAAQVLLFVIPVMLLLFWEYRKLFSRIRTVSSAAEQVVERQFNEPLPEQAEGDFGALGRSFNAMAGRLNNTLQLLQQEKAFLRNLLSDISHQLKTPLSSLIIYNEHLLNDPKMKEDVKASFLERSRQQLDRMEWLIVSLLKLARIESGSIVFRHDVIRIRELIENAALSLRLLSEQGMQTVSIHGSGDMLIQGDEEWLKEAFINLIKNATEHTPQRGEIHIRLEESPLFCTVVVQDYGEGIHPEDLPHIFERFYRGRSKAKPHGIGVGLSLSKLLIEGQGGQISVSSKLGEGTEFRVAFIKNNR
jgi:signal transduction histidine kinase